MPRMPVRGSIFRLDPDAPAAVEDVALWRVVERRLLSPARADAIECLVRLERADGVRAQWRAGDLVTLCEAPGDAGGLADPFATALPGARHGAIALVPGGWPADDWVRRSPAERRLPIASAAKSGTLDILVMAGGEGSGASLAEGRRRLLVDTTLQLRHIRSPGNWVRPAPLIFIGDRSAVGFARAALQEIGDQNALILVECGSPDSRISSEAIFQRACWRDGIIRQIHGTGGEALRGTLDVHRRRVANLLRQDAQIVLASASESFLSAASSAVRSFLGGTEAAPLGAGRRVLRLSLA